MVYYPPPPAVSIPAAFQPSPQNRFQSQEQDDSIVKSSCDISRYVWYRWFPISHLSEKLVAPIVADVQETPEATEVEEEKSPLIPEIDDTLSIEEGARIAVVSKSKKGEFWNKVKEGMEAAVKDVNEAYGFKKDKQITMTFEGPDDEEDVESQINTLDAVIAENPSVVCLSAGPASSGVFVGAGTSL